MQSPKCAECWKLRLWKGSPILGMGAHGRVFRVRRTGGHRDEHHALKVVQAKDKRSAQKELARLNHEAKRCPLLVQPTSELRGTDGLLDTRCSQSDRVFGRSGNPASSPTLCARCVTSIAMGSHGDPRLENLLFCSLTVWADLVGLTTLDSTSPQKSIISCFSPQQSIIELSRRHDDPRAICSSLRPLRGNENSRRAV